MSERVEVISLGGSIVAPNEIDVTYLRRLRERLSEFLDNDGRRRIILVVGGGAPARAYQAAYRQIVDTPDESEQDLIGIAATRLNAQLVRGIFSSYCKADVVTDPTTVTDFPGRVLVAAGWKPGFSTDFDAVVLAERFAARRVINLSNIARVYTADPKADPDARPIDNASWAVFRRLVGEDWVPGGNAPFDPVASRRASELGLTVIVAAGRDLENLSAVLNGRSYTGTTIGPG